MAALPACTSLTHSLIPTQSCSGGCWDGWQGSQSVVLVASSALIIIVILLLVPD
jgi:hypothetical protein